MMKIFGGSHAFCKFAHMLQISFNALQVGEHHEISIFWHKTSYKTQKILELLPLLSLMNGWPALIACDCDMCVLSGCLSCVLTCITSCMCLQAV